MKYSIITINYNNRDGLEKTIQSVINQTCQDFEFIIIDGGSTDGSVDIIKKYADRIDYWVSEPDKGIYNAMNKGILQAHGEYINFMNSGDCYYNDEVLSNVLLHGLDVDIIVGKDCHIDNNTGHKFSSILPIEPSSLYMYVSTLPHQGTFILAKLFSDTMYDENLAIVADWKFYMQHIIINGCSVKYYNNNVSIREQGGVSTLSQNAIIDERNKVINEIYPYGIRKDFDRLKMLDKDVFNKLLILCENKLTRTIIKYIIKIIYRLNRINIL